jgi:hypothetical protein
MENHIIDQLKAENKKLLDKIQQLENINGKLEQQLNQKEGNQPKTLKIFLAATTNKQELKEERESLEDFISKENAKRASNNQYIDYYWCENAEAQFQYEYNEKIKNCDVFIFLFHEKVGDTANKEYEIAYTLFGLFKKPDIRIYEKPFRKEIVVTGRSSKEITEAYQRGHFIEKCSERGHYTTEIPTVNELERRIEALINSRLNKANR